MTPLLALFLLFTAPAPALPFYDWNACPFEGCSYREWKSNKPITVYDTWKSSRHSIAHLPIGTPVAGLSGVVITVRPGVIRLDRDLPEQHLKSGQKLLTYTYIGEGFSVVWFNGRFYSDFDISFAKWPDGQGCGGDHCAATYLNLGEKHWWARIKMKSGRIGWVNMDNGGFDGVDLLA